MPKMTENWHADAEGHVKPNQYVGKMFFHPKTSHLYRVKDYHIDAERGLWLLEYERVGEDDDEMSFIHTVSDFTREGRFLEVAK